jgi:apolipoprotein N-acyltransferase
MARSGARVIAVPSADWLQISTKHYVLAVFRALETGAAIVKSEYSRDSVIVDGSGSIVASAITPQGSAAVLVADVAVPLAARWGDWVGWLCAAAFVARILARVAPARVRRVAMG